MIGFPGRQLEKRIFPLESPWLTFNIVMRYRAGLPLVIRISHINQGLFLVTETINTGIIIICILILVRGFLSESSPVIGGIL